MEDMKREEILRRFYKLKLQHKDFYNRHPELLQILELKIKALENGDCQIIDVGSVIAEVASKIVDAQMYTQKRKESKYNMQDAQETYKIFKNFEVFKKNKGEKKND